MSDEMKIRKMLLRDFQNKISALDASVHIAEKFGNRNRGYGIRTCQHWYRKFREGDFSLEEKPLVAKKKMNSANNKANEKHVAQEDTVQKFIQRKPEITVSKVKKPAKPNIILIRTNANKPTSVFDGKGSASKEVSAVPVEIKKQKGFDSSPFKTDLKLPPNIASRMIAQQTSIENHSIGDGRTSQKTGEILRKPITVRFQNVSPDLAKNTVRKATESLNVTLGKRVAQSTVLQSTPLSLPKGVIYLNPQEIFRQSFSSQTTPVRPTPNGPYIKSVASLPLTGKLVALSPAAQPPVMVIDSDSDDDLVFPEDIIVPPPKIKAIGETFTTYWDMETDKPILLNPTDEMLTPPPIPVIEID